jgi:hypothetical protein
MESTEDPASETRIVAELSERLRTKFPDKPAEEIDHHVVEVLHEFDGQPIRDFVPIFVERDVADRFARAGSASG